MATPERRPDGATPAGRDWMQLETETRRRIQQGLDYRRQFEPTWLTCLAFVAGEQWVVSPRFGDARNLVDIRDVDERYRDADLYIADIITEQRGAALGELQTDTDRPDLLVPLDGGDDPAQADLAEQANRLVEHGWNHEWDGDSSMMDATAKSVDLGTSAIRVRFDPTVGKPRAQAPVGPDGAAITDASKARSYVADTATAGGTTRFKQINEGRITWETGSAFNIVVPPGVPEERNFPWECWVRPVLLTDVQEMYPAAEGMLADEDIGSVFGTTLTQSVTSSARLRDHVWLYTFYERATVKYPKGREMVLAGTGKRLLQMTEQLPYQDTSGEWCSGIVYLHWWKLSDRFYSRGLIASLLDPQRMTNRTATQQQEIVDRGMPKVFVSEGSLVEKPGGAPLEYVEIKKGEAAPDYHPGIGPGQWMQQHREQLMSDAQHASTISALRLGESPQNVDTYSGLALLQEQEASKRAVIRIRRQQAVAKLVELSLEDIKRYWPDGKQLMVAGPSNELEAREFQKSQIPPLYVVSPAKGAPRPRSVASQLQLIADIWQAAVACGAAQHDPVSWMKWLAESYEAGEPLEMPEPPGDDQAEKARIENHALLSGEQVAVAYWDVLPTHLPIHREAEDQAILAGDLASVHRIEQHIQEHQQVAAQNAAQVAQAQPPPGLPGPPGAPVAPGPPGAPLGPPVPPGPPAGPVPPQ